MTTRRHCGSSSSIAAGEAAGGAARYNLQVARNHLFVDNVIEANDRAKTRATLSLRGEGSFLWRVAGVTDGSVAGPWSEPRRFRVVSFRAGAGESDAPPPELEIETAKSYGNICIVVGKTDPGASLVINGEPLKADAGGAAMTDMGMADMPGMSMGGPTDAEGSAPSTSPESDSAPCNLPWAPTGCTVMIPCGPHAVTAQAQTIAGRQGATRADVTREISTPPSAIIALDTPPPRA